MQKKYSDRLGFIDDSQIQKALGKHDLGSLTDTKSINEGLFGQNFYVVSDKGDFVIRGCPHYDWQFPSEQFFANNLHANTSTPVPYPYIVDQDTEIFGWSYVIMPKMPGRTINLKDFVQAYSLEDQKSILEALAACLSNMQEFTWEYPGKYDLINNSIKSFGNSYLEFLLVGLKSRFDKAEKSGCPNINEDYAWADSLLVDKLQNLDVKKGVCVMQDFKLENLALQKKDSGWEVSGLFDLMELYMGYGESDLSRMYAMLLDYNRKDLADYFIHTYASSKDIDINEIRARLPAFLIVDRVINWEWNQRKAAKKIGFREWVEAYYL